MKLEDKLIKAGLPTTVERGMRYWSKDLRFGSFSAQLSFTWESDFYRIEPFSAITVNRRQAKNLLRKFLTFKKTGKFE